MDFQLFLVRFGLAVRRRRVDKKLTQYQLADRVEVRQPTIHRIEKGRQGWDSKTLFGIARSLDCSLADLFIEVEQSLPAKLPPEATAFAKHWLSLPHGMRDDYRKRIEALSSAMMIHLPDEIDYPRPAKRRLARRLSK